ncbi:MAG TPA: subclass B3 metallo-beta-lactamase [Allosphingosinicella sp.]|nr:subclass B3 metallo-beta-lactamase [Allosphingosinicella sp.]
MFASLVAVALQATTPTDGAALARACEGKDGWSDPAPPARIFGNVYYVGTCGISAILITGPRGHILIDGATDQAARHIAANVARLGFRMRDVKLILASHEHIDHVGGLATLQRLSGATVAARGPAVPALTSGATQADDPQHGSLPRFPRVTVGRLVRDREIVRLGPLALTAHATPGHTPGGTSWTWRSCEGRRCLDIVYADSLSAVSADAYRFSAHPTYVATFRASLARVAALRCDLLITPHPSASTLFQRFAAGRLTDRAACRDYAARGTARLDARLREETGR